MKKQISGNFENTLKNSFSIAITVSPSEVCSMHIGSIVEDSVLLKNNKR